MKNIRKFLIIFTLIFLVSCGETTTNTESIKTTTNEVTTNLTVVPPTQETTDVVTTQTVTTNITTTELVSFTINFDTLGGQIINSQTISNPNDFVLPENPTFIGHTFDNWYSDSNYTTLFSPELLDGNSITLYAKWNVNQYKINFLDDDDDLLYEYDIDYNTDLSSFSYPSEPSKEGYEFSGWSIDLPSLMPSEDITLTAQYEIIEYTVNYYFNDVIYSTETVAYNNKVNLPIITGDDYFIFDGWYLDSSKTTLFDDEEPVIKSLDLYSYDLIDYEPVFYTEYNRLHPNTEINDYVGAIGYVTAKFNGGYILTNEYYSLVIYSDTQVDYFNEIKLCGSYVNNDYQNAISNLISEEILSSDNVFTINETTTTVSSVNNLNEIDQLIYGKVYGVSAYVRENNGDLYLEDSYLATVDISDSIDTDSYNYLLNYVDVEIDIDVFYFNKDNDKAVVGYDMHNNLVSVKTANIDWYEPMQDVNALISSMPLVTWQSIDFPVIGNNGSQLTITSSDHEVFNNAGGFLGISSETKHVTFTVTATKGSYSYTDTFTVIVPKINTFQEYHDSSSYYYILEGIVYVENGLGIFIHNNADDYVFLAGDAYQSSVNIGDEIRVLFAKPATNFIDIEVLSSNNPYPNAITGDLSGFYDNTYKDGQVINITGEINVDALNQVTIDNMLDMTLWVDDESHTFPLLGFDGQYVSLQVVKYNGRHVFYEGISDDVLVLPALNDVEKVDMVSNYLDRYMAGIDNVEFNIGLPDIAMDVAITWATTNSNIITNTGQISMIFGEKRSATLTATISSGSVIETKSYLVHVRDEYDISPTNVYWALEATDGDVIKISGIVTAIYEDKVYLQNGDYYLYINSILGNDLVVGNEIVVWGEMHTDYASSYPKREMINASLYSVNDTQLFDYTAYASASPAQLGFFDQSIDNFNRVYEMDLTIVSMDDGNGLAEFACFGSTHIVFNPNDYINYFDALYEVGDVITLEFIMHDIVDGDVFVVNVKFPELSDGYIAWLINHYLDIPTTVTEDLVLDTYNEEYGVLINYSFNKPDIISNLGLVTRPLNGEGDALVYLTVSFTYHGNYYSYSHTLTVLELE